MAIRRLFITSSLIKRNEIYAALLSVLLSLSTASAQERPATNSNPSAVTITASSTVNQVRFAAPSSVVQLRLEVYNAAGRKLFDNELRGGNVLDWPLRDGQAEPLADGRYLCLITVKSLSGKLTQTMVSVTVGNSTAGLAAANAAEMTPQQAEAIGPVEQNAALTVMKEAEQPATTVIAHNGEEGQITRGRGDLSFRLGDFYSGKDSEQMRLTQGGNLGIGFSNPQARLDVDGFVRASQGIVFPDGSVQFSASRKTFGPPSQRPGQFQQTSTPGQEHLLPDIGGTGTTGKIPKWIDGPNGVLGDSLITEANNNIGINTTPDPRFKLDVLGFNRFRAPNASFYLSGFKPGGNDWVYQTVDDDGRFRIWGGTNTTGAERLTIKLDTGNVGIGAPDPTSKLTVLTPNGEYGLTHTNGTVTVGTFVDGIAGWLGTQSNHALKFFTNNGASSMTITPNGLVGIGTPSPTHTLDVNGFFRASNLAGGNVVSETTGGTNSWAKFWVRTPAQQWSIGSSNNFNGNQLYFSNETAGGIQMAIMPNGNVGIGTTNPFTRLEVVQPAATQLRFGASGSDNGGYLISTLPSQAIIAGGARWNGTSWVARDNVASLTATQFGHIEFYTDSGVNVGDTFNPTLRMKIDENGNITQNRDKGGLVKAMAYVNGDGTILRCYNGLTGSSSGNCGFTVNHFADGGYGIDFGFQVTDRFVSVSTEHDTDNTFSGENFGAGFRFTSTSTSINVRTFHSNDNTGTANSPFMIVVY